MRILHVTEAAAAGTLRIVETICDGLARSGHDVILAHGRRAETPDTIGAEADGSFEVKHLEWDRRTVLAQARAFRQLRGLVGRTLPDVIHLHSAFAGLVGGALDSRHPRVYTPHGWASTHRDFRFQRVLGQCVDRYAIHRTDLVGAVSSSEADAGRRLGARQLEVVPNGIPEFDVMLDTGQPYVARSGSSALVVAAGRIVASRRPVETARILRAVQDIAETRWIGDGGPTAVAEVRALDVEVTGWLPHGVAVAEIASASAYLHWSASDGQAVGVLEAMARDVVVVASDIPPNRELLDPAQLFGSEQDAVLMLRRVIESPELRSRLVASQRERASAHRADRMVQRWTDVYARTIDVHDPRRSR